MGCLPGASSGVTGGGGGGQGAECPPETSDREMFGDLSGKKREGKNLKRGETVEEKKKNIREKVENWKWKEGRRGKFQNVERIFFFFFFFCFSLFKTMKIFWGATKMEIFFTGKMDFTPGKKSGKIDFAPSEKNSCYAPGC